MGGRKPVTLRSICKKFGYDSDDRTSDRYWRILPDATLKFSKSFAGLGSKTSAAQFYNENKELFDSTSYGKKKIVPKLASLFDRHAYAQKRMRNSMRNIEPDARATSNPLSDDLNARPRVVADDEEDENDRQPSDGQVNHLRHSRGTNSMNADAPHEKEYDCINVRTPASKRLSGLLGDGVPRKPPQSVPRNPHGTSMNTDTQPEAPSMSRGHVPEERPQSAANESVCRKHSPKIKFFPQKDNGAIDFQRPLPSVKDVTVLGYFREYSKVSGFPLSSLQSLTFDIKFKNRTAVLKISRDCDETDWLELKTRISDLYKASRSRNPRETQFDVWVCSDDTANGIGHNEDLAGL